MKNLINLIAFTLTLCAFTSISFAQTDTPLLMRRPTVSQTHVAFVHAGDVWVVGREGGRAKQLTTGTGVEFNPYFSPDGKWVAFSGQYDGNTDVYIVSAEGGVPRRLTWHPLPDTVVGWSPDGKKILFNSLRDCPISRQPYARLYTLATDGGFPEALPLPMGYEGSYSPDGSRLAYEPLARAFDQWKKYRGGRTSKIHLMNLADSKIEAIPRENSNDYNPMWTGGKVYFLSDRNGAVTLFAYDTASKKVAQIVRNDGLDLKSASAGPGAIVYEQFGALHLLDVNTGRAKKLDIQIAADLPSVRLRLEKAQNFISTFSLSPTGARAVFEARGEVLTVPAEKGNARNLTNTTGVMERDPAWSPDGKWIAYFSDASGEYELHLREQSGMGEVRKIALGPKPSFYYAPTWSPDSKKIAYRDKHLNLWYVEIDKGAPVKVDTATYDHLFLFMTPAWSPDGKWITYAKQLKNHLRAVFIYSTESGQTRQVTDGQSDAGSPLFDKNGKYLYFTASTDIGPTAGWLDLSSAGKQVTHNVYAVVLRKDLPSPLAPESDEEKAEGAEPAEAPKPPAKKEPINVAIDFDDIDHRILALPIPARYFYSLFTGKAGTIFLLEFPPAGTSATGASVHRFDLDKRKFEKVLDGVNGFDVSANGEKMIFQQGQQGQRFTIASTITPLRPGEGALNLSELEVWVDPRAEWKQMYHEVWRIQRDFFYDPNLHGLDLQATIKRYEPYLERLAHRADLNYLFQEMLGNITVGHHTSVGGQFPQITPVTGGLLGCDYKLENGRYRFARVYSGENWTPGLRAPLTQPGVNVKAGEYLLAVNGRELRATDNVYGFFENTAGKSVRLKVGADPNGANAREVTVVPLGNELQIRNRAWVEDNIRKVNQLTNGRVAYVYVPDTGGGGFTNFNRYFFSQIDKEGVVIDERFNGGGSGPDYIIDYLRRTPLNYFAARDGEIFTTPVGGIYGPKAMIVNEYSSSGGDALPFYFRETKLGPLVGKRSWGGLVGIFGEPFLMDGGLVRAPRVAFFDTRGAWAVENVGVAPDVEVDLDPQAWRAGHDSQLEKAVAIVLDELKKKPAPAPRKPAYPNYQRGPAPAASSGGGNGGGGSKANQR
jgi:tricorn protease